MGKQVVRKEGSATEILDEAVHLLRIAPVTLLFSYYVGSLPFVLGFLYFWGDMSRNAFAMEHCSVAAFGVAVLFIWMKCWQSVFAINVYERVSLSPLKNWTFPAVIKMIAMQSLFHATGFIVLPIALLITIPYPWLFGFYQNILVQDYNDTKGLIEITGNVLRLNTFQQRQNYFALMTLTLFQLFVLINIGIAFYTVPFLIKKLFGVDTILSMGGFSYMNSTYIILVFALTYLCVDPVIKTVYTLRFFYAESEKTGADLLSDLKRIKTGVSIMTVFLCLGISLIALSGDAVASESSTNYGTDIVWKDSGVSPEELDKTIDDVLSRREFAWRMPQEKDKDSELPGFLAGFFKWLKTKAKSIAETIESWGKRLYEWLKKILPDSENKMEADSSDSVFNPRVILYSLLAITAAILIFYFVRILLGFRKKEEIETDSVQAVPDISDENITADEMPSDHWLDLAMNLAEQGDYRLAVRALYLGTLAMLSEIRLITIARYKSNREYETELSRRAHEKKDMLETFGDTVSFFDQVWYGDYSVSKEDVDAFAKTQMRMLSFAK